LDSIVNGPLQKQTYQVSYRGNTVYSYSSSLGSSVHLRGSSTLPQDYGCTGSTNAASWNLPVLTRRAWADPSYTPLAIAA
jgi:hypothetical protein